MKKVTIEASKATCESKTIGLAGNERERKNLLYPTTRTRNQILVTHVARGW